MSAPRQSTVLSWRVTYAKVRAMLRQGFDSTDIARLLRVTEAEVYNILARGE